MSLSCSPRPSFVQASTQLVVSLAAFMSSLKAWSMPSKRFVSSGSCARMSALARKMASRLAQFLLTFSHSFSTSSTVPRFFCATSTRARKNSMTLPMPTMPCSSIWCASRLSSTSSEAAGTRTSLSLCCL